MEVKTVHGTNYIKMQTFFDYIELKNTVIYNDMLIN